MKFKKFLFEKSIGKYFSYFSVLLLISGCGKNPSSNIPPKDTSQIINTTADTIKKDSASAENIDTNSIKILISTFRGNEKRNYYGNKAPSQLKLIWKLYLGIGYTNASPQHGGNRWGGAGWTGQPLLVSENGKLFLIQGAFDHNLKKIDAESGEIIWEYGFDDVIKGTGTIFENKNETDPDNRFVILQGSRRGYNFNKGGKYIFSFRAISYMTGKELFRLNSKLTPSYSRDVDGSALVINDTAYLGLENGIFTIFNPDYRYGEKYENFILPEIIGEYPLYDKKDISKHGGNLVAESSPALLSGKVFTAAGSGHVYAYNILKKEIDWDFYIGSDLNGSTVVTSDSCVLVPVEKQYIAGEGGLLKLNPGKSEDESAEWYYPTKSVHFSSWDGGVIGTPAINDLTKKPSHPYLAAFSAIDGYLYLVNYKSNVGEAAGFDGRKIYSLPELVFKYRTGASISSPIIVGNKIISAGYGGIFLFEFDDEMNFSLLDKRSGSFEASPIAYNGRVYIACRDGYLYCLGDEK